MTLNDAVAKRIAKLLRDKKCDGFAVFSYGSIVSSDSREWENFKAVISSS